MARPAAAHLVLSPVVLPPGQLAELIMQAAHILPEGSRAASPCAHGRACFPQPFRVHSVPKYKPQVALPWLCVYVTKILP